MAKIFFRYLFIKKKKAKNRLSYVYAHFDRIYKLLSETGFLFWWGGGGVRL